MISADLATRFIRRICFGAVLMLLTPASRAQFSSIYTFEGRGNWTIDATGLQGFPNGNLTTVVQAGATVEKAYLFTTYTRFDGAASPSIELNINGITFGPSLFISNGARIGTNFRLESFRTDMTTFVRDSIGGNVGTVNFTVISESAPANIQGETLVVVYRNPNERTRNIVLATGIADGTNTCAISWPTPLTSGAGGEFLTSFGIAHATQRGPTGFLATTFNVNGRRLTSSAGGEDDGFENFGEITTGGIGDSPDNPNPTALPTNARTDDEYYNLAAGNSQSAAPFLTGGETSFDLTTSTGSEQLPFFVGFNGTVVVPEPGQAVIIGVVSAILTFRRRLNPRSR